MIDAALPLASPFLIPDADGIAVLTLERPAGANLVDDALVAALGAVLATLDGRQDVRGLIITSSRPHFLLGRDPAWLQDLAEAAPNAEPAAVAARLRPYANLLRRLAACPKPVVAALNGSALGAGLELALACTVRLAADDPRLRLGFPDARIGFMPMAGGTQRLARLIGGDAAAPLLLEGRTLAPAAALELGLVDALIPPDDLIEAARQWLRTLLAEGVPTRDEAPPWLGLRGVGPQGGGMSASSGAASTAIRAALSGGAGLPLDAALEGEAMAAVDLLRGGVPAVLLRTLVTAKAAADRVPWRPPLPHAELPNALVLGAGRQADALRQHLMAAGLEVYAATNAADLLRFEDTRIAVVMDVSGGSLAARAALLGVVERVLGDDTLIALAGPDDGVGALSADLTWADRVVGLHLPPPGPWAPGGVAEVVATAATSAPARSIAVDLARRLGRTPFATADGGPRYLARLQAAYLRAALALAARGLPPAAIEGAARAAGLAESPLALARRLGQEGVRSLLSRGEEAALLGVLRGNKAASADPADPEELLAPVRAVATQAVETALVADAAAADLAAVLGLGWPAGSGGPLGSFARAAAGPVAAQ